MGELSRCWSKVNQDFANLEGAFAKLKEEMWATRRKPELLAPPVVDAAHNPKTRLDSSATETYASDAIPPSTKKEKIEV
jgi:hypothetical protein